jgi:hypothetical protein
MVAQEEMAAGVETVVEVETAAGVAYRAAFATVHDAP